MNFDWEKFIELAEKLNQQESEEAFRTAVSRAYYSVFCTLRNLKGFKDYTKGSIHYKVIDSLKQSQDKTDQLIGQMLDSLRKKRNNADYNGDISVDEKFSHRSIVEAREIFKYLNK